MLANPSRWALWLAAAALSVGCDTLRTRSDIENDRKQALPAKSPVVQTAPTAPEATTQTSAPLPTTPATGVQTPPPLAVPPAHAAIPQAPSDPAAAGFLQKEPPRVGLILGAGGMKTFAHVGVLKEFARARIPVQSVVGLEWGAAMAAIYAMQGQANEVEWKSFRLRENELPSSSFFGGNAKAQPVALLRDFLEVAFGRAQLERNRVDFACPAYSPKAEKLLWLNRGSARDAIARCLSYPPFYLDAGGWIGSPLAVEEAAAYLRARGANFVIFVNPLAQGELLPDRLQSEDYADSVLWAEIRRHVNRPQIPGVNMTIPINATGHPVTDFESRRQLMEIGSKASADVVNKLVSKYGF